MRRLPRPCLDCGRLSQESRCPIHTRRKRRVEHNPAYDDPAYRRARDQMITEWRRRYGDWCPGAPDLEHAAHRVDPPDVLTLDHVVALSEDGSNRDRSNLRVLCGSANSAKGGTNRTRGGSKSPRLRGGH